jgi:hypothetical protein
MRIPRTDSSIYLVLTKDMLSSIQIKTQTQSGITYVVLK